MIILKNMKTSKIIRISKKDRSAKQPFIIVGCLIEKNGKFLLVKEDGKWNQPAGWLELKENIVEGAKRETEEETGIKVKITDFLGVYTLIKQKRSKILHAVKFIFIGKPISKKKKSLKGIKTDWFSFEEIKKMSGQFWDPDVQKEIDDFIQGKKYLLEVCNNFTDLSN